MKALSVLLAAMFFAAFSTPALHRRASNASPNSDAAFFASGSDGNNLLRHCDETDTSFPTAALIRQEYIARCDLWVVGIEQGVELTEELDVDPLRSKVVPPSPGLAKAQQEQAKAEVDYLAKLGFAGVSTPDADMCSPDVPVDQLRRVVIKWLKDNPTKLNESAPLLVVAALRNTYTCPNGVTANDWATQH